MGVNWLVVGNSPIIRISKRKKKRMKHLLSKSGMRGMEWHCDPVAVVADDAKTNASVPPKLLLAMSMCVDLSSRSVYTDSNRALTERVKLCQLFWQHFIISSSSSSSFFANVYF